MIATAARYVQVPTKSCKKREEEWGHTPETPSAQLKRKGSTTFKKSFKAKMKRIRILNLLSKKQPIYTKSLTMKASDYHTTKDPMLRPWKNTKKWSRHWVPLPSHPLSSTAPKERRKSWQPDVSWPEKQQTTHFTTALITSLQPRKDQRITKLPMRSTQRGRRSAMFINCRECSRLSNTLTLW